MQINRISTVGFKTLFRFSSYVDCNGRKRETQNTTGKREDLNYMELARIAKQRFSDFDKINVMPMNGSDGTESYMLGHAFLKTWGEKKAKEKVFPIKVSDIDPFIIKNFGQEGLVSFEPRDIEYFGKDFEKYFEETDMSELPQIWNGYSLRAKAFKLKPSFKELFTFKVEDFQSRVEKIKDNGNSVIIIRNCLAQSFGWPEAGLICHRVSEILKNSSLFVVGQYDRDSMRYMTETLKDLCNLKEVGMNIFSKQANKPLNWLQNLAMKFVK